MDTTALIDWFATSARDLPWRRPDCTAWGVLVSEIMLQQTPVARVEPIWHEWLARWPTPAALAAASQGEVLRAWGKLGYPRRALRLHECARIIAEMCAGISVGLSYRCTSKRSKQPAARRLSRRRPGPTRRR